MASGGSSEIMLRAILEAAIDFAIITLDEEGVILDWNSGAELMLGHSREEAIGQHTDLIFTPEDRDAGIAGVEIGKARTVGRSLDERWHLHKDGTRFFMSGVMTPLEPGGRKGFVKVARNITDRKLQEEALFYSQQQHTLAVQSARMGEWVWDLETDVVTVSDQSRILLGWPLESSDVPANVLLSHIYPPDEPGFREELRQAVEGTYIFQSEYRVKRADTGQLIWIFAYGRVVNHYSERPCKMIGVIYDITSRKTVEKQKDDFISLASHELKTPVTAIKVYSEILQEYFSRNPEDNHVALLEKLNGQVDRLTNLIRTLLDSSTLIEGKLKLIPEPFNLNAAISEQVELIRESVTTHLFELDLSPVGILNADIERILQVINNFVYNAIKYAPAGSTITIRTIDQFDKAMVEVIDQGPGIPAEARPYLFDRYYRVPGHQATRHEGFGLGLYICSEIIKQHHGTIGVESVEGEGATFFFTLLYS